MKSINKNGIRNGPPLLNETFNNQQKNIQVISHQNFRF
jgi:hypothetical protein